MNNIQHYINLANSNNSPVGNGMTYKDDLAFDNKHGICYISEYALLDLIDLNEQGIDLTDEELIEQGYAETYNSIIAQIVDADFDCPLTADQIAEQIYYNADWAYISTYICEFNDVIEEN